MDTSAWCIQILGGQVSITKRYYLMGSGGHESCEGMPDISESTTDNRRFGRASRLEWLYLVSSSAGQALSSKMVNAAVKQLTSLEGLHYYNVYE